MTEAVGSTVTVSPHSEKYEPAPPPQAGADSVLLGTCSLPLPGTLVPEPPAGGGSRVASPSPSVASPKAVLPTSPHAAIPAYDDNAQSLVRAGDG